MLKVSGCELFSPAGPYSSLAVTSIGIFILPGATVTKSSIAVNGPGCTVIFTVPVAWTPLESSKVYVKLSVPKNPPVVV